jgi:hypothetical protein
MQESPKLDKSEGSHHHIKKESLCLLGAIENVKRKTRQIKDL